LLVLGLVVSRFASAALVRLGGLGAVLDGLGGVLTVGVIVLWARRARYERITVDEHGGVAVAGAGLLAAAAGWTLLVGLNGAIFGAAHLEGVIQVAMERGYAYDFRLASLLLLGIGMVFASVLCLTAVRGLAHGQRRAWDRAMIGTLLLLVVTIPIVYVPVQGLLAAAQAWPAALNVVVLVGAWRRLEAGVTVA
jgi:hypothetical protein